MEKGYPKDKELYKYNPTVKLKSISQAKKELLEYLLSGVIKSEDIYTEEMKHELLKDVEICGLKAKAHRDLNFIINGIVPENYEDVAPYILYLYRTDVLLDNITAQNMEEWNGQVLYRLDPSLISMNSEYQNGLIRCLMIEQSRIDADFKPYELKWVEYMRGRM